MFKVKIRYIIIVIVLLIGCAYISMAVNKESKDECLKEPLEMAQSAIQCLDGNEVEIYIDWLKKNAQKDKNGNYIWESNQDTIYADANKMSAYIQATVIDAFLADYKHTKDESSLKWAERAAKVLETDTENGGIKKTLGDGQWFVNYTNDVESYGLIGHVRTLVAIKNLYEVTQKEKYHDIYKLGENALFDVIECYDTDYCFRDNLLIKEEVRFRFCDNYNGQCDTSSIISMSLRDPMNGNTAEVSISDENGEFICDFSDFNIDIFRTEWLELEISYNDNLEQKMILQKESLIDNEQWVDVKDGDVLYTGSGEKRSWIIPIRINDLGYEVSETLMFEYKEYFEYLSQYSEKFYSLRDRSKAYYNLNYNEADYEMVDVTKRELPMQTPALHIYSFDENDVLCQVQAGKETTEFKFDKWGNVYATSGADAPFYSLYVIWLQAKSGKANWENYSIDVSTFTENVDFWSSYDFLLPSNIERIKSEPAYNWIKNNANVKKGMATWHYYTNNAYNDLVQEAGWVSAYGQALMLDALLQRPQEYQELMKKGCYAYGAKLKDGGLASIDYRDNIWFEEVPNESHIFNANILSINTMMKVNALLNDTKIEEIVDLGVESLKENMWNYDNGYWSKYDMNPQKEILFQLDWIEGETSPLIDSITLQDPIGESYIELDVGEEGDATGYPFLLGREWDMVQIVDGDSVRSLSNGYNRLPVEGWGTDHNAFFYVVLPDLELTDYFDLKGYKLVIRYKDVAEGVFEVKRQSICEGNILEFEQIPNAKIQCTGDGAWKEAEIWIRPQDLGWFMGAVYQDFHVQQIQELAEETGDWFFEQYAEKWKYYLDKESAN